MSKELKFRAWDEGNKIMHSNFQFIKTGDEGNDWIVFISDEHPLVREDGINQLFDEPNPFFSQQLKIMQYTGFIDNTGSEIYYGDLYSDNYSREIEVTEMTVAHWLIDEDRMNMPMNMVRVVGNKYEGITNDTTGC